MKLNAIALVAILCAATANADPGVGTIAISGAVAAPLTISATDLAPLPRHQVAAADSTGKTHSYSGVFVEDILTLAHATIPTTPPYARWTYALLVESRDGFQVAFSAAEIDPTLAATPLLLVDTMDGAPLSADSGPYRILATQDKKQARWAKQVSAFVLKKIDATTR